MLPQGLNRSTEISLKSLRLDINIVNHLTTLTIDQDFFNSGSNPIECEYAFPVLKNSVVTALNILLPDGSVLNSHIEEEQKALETYQDALSQGHAAALGKSENPDSMVVYVGNILPLQSVKVQIIIASPVSAELNSWKFIVPSEFVVNLSDANGKAYPIEARIQITSQGAISDYNSTWDFAWNLSEDKLILSGQVNLALIPEKSLSITYKNSNTYIPTCVTQRKGDKYAAMISFIPLNTDGKNPEYLEGTGEYIFILDRSGSMYGQRIQIATNAAVIFLKSLPLTSKFNIISFGTRSYRMFPVSQPASTEVIAQAISQLSVMNADMGGNDICSALKLAFQFEPENEYPRSLFLITDGGESDWRPSLSLIKENKSECRIHGFGIQASDSDAKFLSEAAELGKGSSFFVYDIQELGKNVVKALSKCVMPCMNKWEINWVGRAVPTSKNIGSVYYGEMFTQYVLMDTLPGSLPVIRYFDTYQKRDIEVNIHRSEIVEGEQIFKLWAKNQIAELSMNREINSREIIEISKDYQVVSSLTAFVCVKTQDGVATGDLKTIKVASRSSCSSFLPSAPIMGGRMFLPGSMPIGGGMAFLPHPGLGSMGGNPMPPPAGLGSMGGNPMPPPAGLGYPIPMGGHHMPIQGGRGYPMPMPMSMPKRAPCMDMPMNNSISPGYPPHQNYTTSAAFSPMLPGNPVPNIPYNHSMPNPGFINPPLPFGNSSFPPQISPGGPILPCDNQSTTRMNPGMNPNMGLPQSLPQFSPNPTSVLGGMHPSFSPSPPAMSVNSPPPINPSYPNMGSISKESKISSIPNKSGQNMEFMPNNIYFEIITKIRSEGYWDYNEVLLLFKELKNYRTEICEMEDNVVATIFILCYLAAKYSEKIDEWVLLKRKAINWLAVVGVDFETSKALFTIN